MNSVKNEITPQFNDVQINKKWGGYCHANINGQELHAQNYKIPLGIPYMVLQQQLKDTMQLETGYDYMICVFYRYGPRCGEMFDITNYKSSDIVYNIYKEYDASKEINDTVKYVTLYKCKKTKAHGGGRYRDIHNDCLFHALNEAGFLPNEISTKIGLKRYLGLNRDDKIPIELIEKIEELYLKHDTTINVTGEYQYNSKFTKPKNIQLCLKKEHYTLKNNEDKNGFKYNPKGYNIFFSTPRTQEQVYLYCDYDIDEVLIYNGSFSQINRKTLSNMKREDNIMIDSNNVRKKMMKDKTENEIYEYLCNTLQEERTELINSYNEMFNVTNGEVNLYKYRNIKFCALEMLRMKSKQCQYPEEIEKREAEWINESYMGGFQFYRECENIQATCSDINSSYPNIMQRNFNIPMTKPNFIHYTHETKFFKDGVYRCRIINNTNKTNDELRYKININHKRTKFNHIYLNTCIEMGLTIEMINDNEHNAMVYDTTKNIKCCDLFGKYVEYFYDLKKRGVKSSKLFLNILYGALSQKNRSYKKAKPNKIINIDTTKHEIENMYFDFKHLDNEHKISSLNIDYIKKEHYYTLPYARISTIISANSYKLLVQQINKISCPEDILRIHTDSITLKNYDNHKDKFKYSTNLGEWKLEKQGLLTVRNLNDFEWN